MRRGQARAEQVQLRQAEGAVDQRIGQQQVGRNGGDRDPQRRLRPVHRAHEIAQGQERPGRHEAPAQPVEIAAGKRRRLPASGRADEDVATPQLQGRQRHADHERRPQSDAQRAAHDARLARAIGLRGQRRYRRDEAHADAEGSKQHGVRQRGRRHHLVAQPAQQHQVGRHHGDLAELRQRHRPGQAQRVDDLDTPSRLLRRQLHAGRDIRGCEVMAAT